MTKGGGRKPIHLIIYIRRTAEADAYRSTFSSFIFMVMAMANLTSTRLNDHTKT